MHGASDVDTAGAGQFGLMALAVMLALLAAMIFLVLAEVLVPPGSVPPPHEWWRLTKARAARTRRYGQIVRIAVRHGLGRALRGRWRAGSDPARREQLARSLTAALDEAGVTFVKLGQVLSTRRDLLPAEFVTELARLQDRVAPAPWVEVEATLVTELGRPVDEVFATISPEPLAAASVAQVHAATLASGEEVVIKIQRPGIGPVVERDLDIVDRLAGTLARTTSWAARWACGTRRRVRTGAAGGAGSPGRGGEDGRGGATARDAVAPGGARGAVHRRPLGSCSGRTGTRPRRPDLAARGLDPHALAARCWTPAAEVAVEGGVDADPQPATWCCSPTVG